MKNTIEQFSVTSKANLETLQGLATQAFGSVEKLVELNMATSKATLNETFSNAQAVLGAKDAQELMALQSGLMKPLADKSAAYAQNIQTILSEGSAEAQKAFTGAMETLTKNAPAGSESALAAFKNALTAGQNAVETVQTSVKKATKAA